MRIRARGHFVKFLIKGVNLIRVRSVPEVCVCVEGEGGLTKCTDTSSLRADFRKILSVKNR